MKNQKRSIWAYRDVLRYAAKMELGSPCKLAEQTIKIKTTASSFACANPSLCRLDKQSVSCCILLVLATSWLVTRGRAADCPFL